MKLWILTAALVLTPISVTLAADPPGSKPASRGALVPVVKPVGTLSIAGVQGERADGKIDVLSVTGTCEQVAQASAKEIVSPRDAASGLPTGKRQHKPFTITKRVDKASPVLMQAAASGKHFPTVVIQHGGNTITLKEATISGVQASGAGDKPTETVTLNFASCAGK